MERGVEGNWDTGMDDGHAGMHAHVVAVVRLGQVDTGTDADALRTAESVGRRFCVRESSRCVSIMAVWRRVIFPAQLFCFRLSQKTHIP